MRTPTRPLSARYRIRILGHLDPAWSVWFDGLTLTRADDGTTELVGPLVDQAALFGLLARLRDLGATLLLVERLEGEGASSASRSSGAPPSRGSRSGRPRGAAARRR